MSMTPDGRHECDRCGADVAGGGVGDAVVVSDLDPDRPGVVRILHFCRDRTGADGESVRGCAHRLLSPAMIKHHTERMEATRG